MGASEESWHRYTDVGLLSDTLGLWLGKNLALCESCRGGPIASGAFAIVRAFEIVTE